MRDGNGMSGFMRLSDMAAAYGDGLIPELYDLPARPAEPSNVVELFARPNATAPDMRQYPAWDHDIPNRGER